MNLFKRGGNMPPTRKNNGIQCQGSAQPGNGTPTPSESAILPEVEEVQADPGSPVMRPTNSTPITTRPRRRNVQAHNIIS